MKKSALIVLASFALVGCSGVSDQLGLKKQAPDEFAVIKRAPLQLPPNYTLRPPTPGAARPQEKNTTDTARLKVLGTQERVFNAGESSGEQALLGKLGAQNAQQGIRETLEEETGIIGVQEKSVAERLLFMESSSASEDGVVIDPFEESERLKETIQENNATIEKR